VAYRLRSREDRRFNAVLTYLLLGIVGGTISATVAALLFPLPATLETATDPFLSAAPVLVLGTATLGGVVAEWLIAALAVSRAPGKFRCRDVEPRTTRPLHSVRRVRFGSVDRPILAARPERLVKYGPVRGVSDSHSGDVYGRKPYDLVVLPEVAVCRMTGPFRNDPDRQVEVRPDQSSVSRCRGRLDSDSDLFLEFARERFGG